MMGSCSATIGTAVCFAWLTFIACGFTLIVPFWRIIGGVVTSSEGLFLSCTFPYNSDFRDCGWLDINSLPGWYQACTGMWTGGTVVVLACAIGAMFLCCSCCRGRGCATFLTMGSFFASGLFISTVVLYGIKLGNLFDRNQPQYYEWGFYVSWGASLLSLITSGVFSCSIYQIGRINSMY